MRSGEDVRSLDDLRRLPFSMKADLREHYPFGLLAVPREELVRVHASSGTGGKATVVGYTRRDLDTWTDVMARCLATAGVRAGMLVHNANGYGLFTGGLGFHQGAERLGATVVPVSGGFTERQVTLLRDLRAQVLFATPSYALHIGHALAEHGIGPDDLALEVGVFGGEPWTPAMGAAIERALGPGGREHVRALGDRSGPAWRSSAARCGRARTSTRTTSSPRSSIPRPASRCPTAPRASSSSAR